jgi:D-sedoheptulose 7-phosphate isomerase
MGVIVFTNGCFDIIHPGHIDLLNRAKQLGTKLIVGINSDSSVRRIKGEPRPFFSQDDRAEILKNLKAVDEVKIFDETTPEKLIKQIKPDVLVKGGDWKTSEIIGADFVRGIGGKVISIPLKVGYSSSGIVEKIKSSSNNSTETSCLKDISSKLIGKSLISHIEVIQKLIKKEQTEIERCGEFIFETFKRGNKILICGNGGSAADAQHIAAEFVGRFETERKALPAIALTTDTSALTALTNDYNFERVFSRQIEALGREGDLLIAISTSGNSANVLSAVMFARSIGCKTLAMTGSNGKKLASLCDVSLMVPSTRTARIQEGHITVAHIWCEMIDFKFKDE